MIINNTQFQYLQKVSANILQFSQPCDSILANFFRSHKNLGKQDRLIIAETIYCLLRNFEKIQAFLIDYQQNTLRWQLLCALCIHTDYQPSQLQHICTEEEYKILENLQNTFVQYEQHINIAAELPLWLIEKLSTLMTKAEIIQLGQALNQPAPLDIRVNTLKAKRNSVLQQLQKENFQSFATPYSPLGIRFTDKPALNKHPLYLDGTFEIQDEGSQLLSLFTKVKRNEIAVDFCAGAGGKTLAMGAMMSNKGRIYAFDTVEKRLNNLKTRLKKSALSIVHPLLIQDETDNKIHKLYGKCDCVLVDAPCSGLGTLRRSPDLKYRQSPQSIADTIQLQARILNAAAKLLKPKGRLIYATCSILVEENEQQVQYFLQNNSNFKQINCDKPISGSTINTTDGYLKLSPNTHQTDGFFAVMLEKQ